MKLRVLQDLDVDGAIAAVVRNGASAIVPTSKEGVLAALHKARLYHPAITEQEREISKSWLINNGYTFNIASFKDYQAELNRKPQ